MKVPVAIMLAAVMSTAGCIDALQGSDDDDTDGPALDGPYKVFLAARGDAPGPVVAALERVTVVGGGQTTFLTTVSDRVDLTELSNTGQALLVAAGSVSGRIDRHDVDFADVTSGGDPLASEASWSVPFTFNVTGEAEVTLTLDLGASVTNGTFAPESDSLIAENANGVIAEASKSQLTGQTPPPRDVPPLSEPTVRVTAAGGSFPSWKVGTKLNFTAVVDEDEQDHVMDAFWFFPDGNTKQGIDVQHTFRKAGLHRVNVTIQGTQGQQASASVVIEAWFEAEGSGEGLQPVIPDRNIDTVEVKVPGPDVQTVRVVLNFSGAQQCLPEVGQCSPDQSEVDVRLFDPDGELIAEATEEGRPKVLEAVGPFPSGPYTLEVEAESGASIGYEFTLEARYL